MSAISATFDGVAINDLEKWTLQGSSSAATFLFPRTSGALLKPSNSVNRTITLTSQHFPPNATTKSQIHVLQRELNRFLIAKQNATLVVDNVAYPNATPLSVSQDVLATTEYMTYSIVFSLDFEQPTFEPTTFVDGRVRYGAFKNYETGVLPVCGFPIFDNYELGLSVTYDLDTAEWIPGNFGRGNTPVGGVNQIGLECWMVGQTNENMQKYIADWILGPLGKQGDLDLDGEVYENAILVSVTNQQAVGSSMKYSLQFQSSLTCCP